VLRVERKPFDNFIQACQTDKTRGHYVAALRLFMTKYKIGPSLESLSIEESTKIMASSCEEILKQKEQDLENTIIDYIESIRDLAEDTITQRLAGIKMFLTSNRIFLKWEYINSFKHSNKKKHRDEAYTHEQISKILEYCSEPRMKTIILMFASTGLRVGAFEGLQLKHLKSIETEKGDIYEFIIYEGFKEEYITYCTPETRFAIDEYLEYRKRAGEVITKESYLVRKQFDRNDLQQVKNKCEPVKTTTISNLVHNILVKAGIRIVKEHARRGYRHDIKMEHGFRKFYTSQLVNANLNETKRLLLEGHSLPRNDPSYVRVKKELLSEYLKAIDYLTIDPKFKLQEQVIKLTEDKNEVTLMELKHREEMNLVLKNNNELQNRISKLEKLVPSDEENKRIDKLYEMMLDIQKKNKSK
jgi:integrase